MAINKQAIKKPASKKVIIPVKKAVPTKKVVQAKKAVPAKVVAKKTTPKPVAKKAVAEVVAKIAFKKAVKPAVKIASKKALKPTAKPVTKTPAPSVHKGIVTKAATKAAPKKTIMPQKKATPLPKKVEIKKPLSKTVPVKTIVKPLIKTAPIKIPAKPIAAAPKAVDKPIVKAAPPKPVVQKPVILPKIMAKTSRKYEPDFTKSVLDKAPIDPGAPIVMYGDADLAEFRELIQRKLGSAKKELAYLQGLITRKDDTGGDEGENRYMTMEDGSLSMEREQLSQMASRQITFIDHLEKALMRIENKTYGICRVTGKLIDKARLRAVPHATLSIEAKMSGVK